MEQSTSEEESATEHPSTSSSQRLPSPSMMRTRGKKTAALVKTAEAEDDDQDEYLVVNKSLLTELVNSSVQSHGLTSCTNPHFKVQRVVRRVISVDLKLTCDNCSFDSGRKSMYRTMTKKLSHACNDNNDNNDNDQALEGGRGNRASTLNAALASAVLNSMIGQTQIRQIFLQIGVDIGCKNSLCNLIDQVGEIKKNLANKSMENAVTDLVAQESLCPGSTFVTQDGYYNNRFGKGPTQAGTQSHYTSLGHIIDNEGNRISCKIIDHQTDNKLCKKGKELASKNWGSCAEGHPDCTATLPAAEAIGQEGRLCKQSLEKLRSQGYIPKLICVDGDDSI